MKVDTFANMVNAALESSDNLEDALAYIDGAAWALHHMGETATEICSMVSSANLLLNHYYNETEAN